MFVLRSARGRAILAGTVLVLLLVGMGALAVWRTHDMQHRHRGLEHTSAAATALEGAQAGFWQAQGALSALVISGDPAFVDDYDNAFAESEQKLAEARAEFLAMGKTAEVSALDDLTRRIGQFNQTARWYFPLLVEADHQAAIELANASMSELMATNTAIIADLQDMVHEQQEHLAAEVAAADRTADTTLWILIGFSTAAIVVAAATAAGVVVSVVRPLASLQSNARAITSGNLQARAKVSGPEEVASLARDFNEMTDALAAKTEALRESETRYRLLAENATDIIWTMDMNLRLTYESPSVARIRGYTPEEAMAQTMEETLTPASLELASKVLVEELAPEAMPTKAHSRSRTLELEHTCKDGSTVWLEVTTTFLRDEDGRAVGLLGASRDISERKRAERGLAESRQILENVTRGITEGILLLSKDLEILWANESVSKQTGYEMAQILGSSCYKVTHHRETPCGGRLDPCPVREVLETGKAVVVTHIHINAAGEEIPIEVTVYPVRDEKGEIVQFVHMSRDVSERKRAEKERERLHAELEVRAITDGLTDLYNHAHFFQRLAEETERSKRYNHGFAVVMIDVDNFKKFNDSHGHQMGDEVLRLVADSIRSGLRRSDLAFRYGGDEFAAMLLHADAARARAVIDRINRRLARSLKQMNDGAAARVSLSAGAACFPEEGSTPDELVTVADTALYSAKWAARARDVMEEGYAVESLTPPPATSGEAQTGTLSSAASSLAEALRELGVPDALAELNLRTVTALGTLAEIKDPYIRGHQERTSDQAATLAEEMGLSPDRVRGARLAALLHDLGKAGISKRILNKPGKLTEEEFAEIKEHPPLGSMMIISEIEALQQLVPIVRHHHERFDGKGYPDGLAGQDIPLEARILAVVDAFDAMTHERAYRKALGREEALAELRRGAGTQFDPAVVEAFLAWASREGAEPEARKQPASEDKQLATVRAAKTPMVG
jgi:diguanylate cyclase (GGDEF)-like protein/PAS domain S-box-containing protein